MKRIKAWLVALLTLMSALGLASAEAQRGGRDKSPPPYTYWENRRQVMNFALFQIQHRDGTTAPGRRPIGTQMNGHCDGVGFFDMVMTSMTTLLSVL